MLSTRQCCLFLFGLHVAGISTSLPIVVNASLGKIRIQPSKWRQRAWKTWLFLLSCRIIHMLGFGAWMLWNREGAYLGRNLPLYSCFLIGGMISILGMYLLFIRSPELTVTIFNELLAQRIVGPTGRLTVYEKLSLTLPFHVLSATALFTMVVIINPEALYPFCPSCAFWQQEWAFLSIVGTFVAASLFTITFIAFSAFMILIFLHNCNEWTSARAEELKTKTGISISSVYSLCIQCRQLQLLIQLFNEAFAYYIFALKVSAITECVLLISFGVHLFHLHPEAVVYILIGMDLIASFPILFDKGFVIPVQNEQLKGLVRSRCRKAVGFRFLLKSVKSLRNVGIKVGSFHQLERMSTLNFLGFVTVNVARSLIALKKR